MIEKSMLQDMFDGIGSKTDWDINGPMLWGYFFTDTDRAKLSNAASVLDGLGYSVVGLREPTPDDDDQKTIMLHVERVEVHSVDSLHVRNCEFQKLAAKLGLSTYDGMDVGPAPDPPSARSITTGDPESPSAEHAPEKKPWWKLW